MTLADVVSQEQRGFVMGVVRSLRVPRDEQEDIAQEVLLVLHRRAVQLPEGAVRSWLRVVAAQVARNQRRGARRRQARVQLVEDVEREPRAAADARLEDLLARRQLQAELRRALARLDRGKLAVLQLSVLEGFTADEIGVRLRIPANTASSRLRAAKRALREALAQSRL